MAGVSGGRWRNGSGPGAYGSFGRQPLTFFVSHRLRDDADSPTTEMKLVWRPAGTSAGGGARAPRRGMRLFFFLVEPSAEGALKPKDARGRWGEVELSASLNASNRQGSLARERGRSCRGYGFHDALGRSSRVNRADVRRRRCSGSAEEAAAAGVPELSKGADESIRQGA